MRSRNQGLVTVEFAIIGTVVMIVLFGAIELGRTLFVMNTLTEVTRRCARVAAVCPVNDPAPAQVAVFANGGGSSTVVAGLTPANIVIEYLDIAGTVVADPANEFQSIRYVRARLVNFTHELVIPFLAPLLPMPPFATTLPRESLGIPREGVVEPC